MDSASRHATAWLALAVALGFHVFDEAAHDFLSFYNPSVAALRERLPWLPLPQFTFPVWLGGLIVGVTILLVLTPLVLMGRPGLLYASYALGVLMTFNALGHLAGSVYYGRMLPGVYSSPLLLMASLALLYTAWRRGHG